MIIKILLDCNGIEVLHTQVMCDDVSVNVCSVYFKITKNANLFCMGYIQSILHGGYN